VRDVFRRGGIDNAELDARLLAEFAFGLTKLELVTRERDMAWKEGLENMHELAARRLRGEPVVRILGEKEFFGLTFKLNAATLVPRPETEMLVVKVLELIEGRKKPKVLDLGTGTGCIGISILVANPVAKVVAVDVAPEAIAMANANAETHQVRKRFDARAGSWFDSLNSWEEFDAIVSNPPYIATDVVDTLAREVKDHDPLVALDGGADGLEAYRAILTQARTWLRRDGAVIVEIGYDQGRQVKALFEDAGLADVFIERDLGGLDRMVIGTHS
jgi:release factor glutamine methyltransferase